MQKRYRHFLRPTVRQNWPTCVIAVDASTQGAEIHSANCDYADKLAGWIALTATLKQGTVTITWHANGIGTKDWWMYVDHTLRYHTNLWIVSWNTPRIATILGLWEEMEERRSYVTNRDERVIRSQRAGTRLTADGYVVLSNPPTIICFKRRTLPGTVTWIDMKNFGYSKSTELAAGRTLPVQLLGTLTDIMSFLKAKNLGSVRPTTGSQALYSWKFRYLRHTIHVSNNESQDNLGSAALYGGRNECYRLGTIQGPITQFDINSLYPSMYSRHPVPIRLRCLRSNPSDGDINIAIRGKNCIARVLVETDTPNVPKRDARGLYFPIGRISTVLAWPELELALETAKSVKFTEIATFDMAHALSEYAKDLYGYRTEFKRQGSIHLARYVKSMLVSLSGKFGQHQKRWQISQNQNAPGPWEVWTRQTKTGGIQKCRSLAWTVEEEVDDGLSPEAIPEITAFVNSWGRRILWEWMENVGRQKIIYVDTDSIWMLSSDCGTNTRDSGGKNEELGAIRCVQEYQRVDFHGCKHYVADGKTTCSGSGDAYDMFGRWRYHVSSAQRIKPYTIGRVKPDNTVLPLIARDW